MAVQGEVPTTNNRTGDAKERAGWSVRQVVDIDGDELGLARSIVGETDHLVADHEAGDTLTTLFDDTRQVASLAGGELGGPPLAEQSLANFGLARVDSRRL